MIEACGQTRMALTEDGTLDIWGAAGADGRLGLATSGWVETPAPLELADVRTFSAGLTTSGAITESGEAYLWGTVYSYVMLYDENGDPAASVVDGPLVSYGSAPVRLYENAQALAFGDAFVLLLRADGTILAWGSNDHGQMADGDWTKAELADGDDEDEKDVVITESDQFVFPAVIMVPAESLRSTTARLFRLRRLRGFRAGGAGGGVLLSNARDGCLSVVGRDSRAGFQRPRPDGERGLDESRACRQRR